MRAARWRQTRTPMAGAVLAVSLLAGGCAGLQPTAEAPTSAAVPTTPETVATSTTTSPSQSPTTGTPAASPTSTTAAPSPTPTTTASPRPTPSAPKPTPTAKPTPTEGMTLHVGDTGAYVRSVQQKLSNLGYWLGTPDGQYGGLTAQSVMALQKAAGLGRDGVFGPATRRALEAGIRPRSRVGGSGIEIDKARQLLLVVRAGRVTTIINTSTGNGEVFESYGQQRRAVTPSGSYQVFRSVNGNDEGPLGDLWRPRYFNGGIAVHGSPSIPAYPASHGCARVSNPAMDMIWAQGLMPIGGRVTVY